MGRSRRPTIERFDSPRPPCFYPHSGCSLGSVPPGAATSNAGSPRDSGSCSRSGGTGGNRSPPDGAVTKSHVNRSLVVGFLWVSGQFRCGTLSGGSGSLFDHVHLITFALTQRFVDLPALPQRQEQHRELSRHGDDRTLLCILATSCGQS